MAPRWQDNELDDYDTRPLRVSRQVRKQVIIPNLKVRPVSSDNPLPVGMRKVSKQIASRRGAWRISDEDNAFLLEESHSREDARFYNYDQEKVDKLRQVQEQKPQLDTWKEPCWM